MGIFSPLSHTEVAVPGGVFQPLLAIYPELLFWQLFPPNAYLFGPLTTFFSFPL
jgi:hypothetical protein